MTTDSSVEFGPIVASPGECPSCPGVHVVSVHHRFYPEIEGEGMVLREAVQHLLQQLGGEWGATPDAWHRGRLEQVLSELKTVLAHIP